jgi:hypothetical protein
VLIEKGTRPRVPRNLRRERKLWHRPDHRQLPLGCQGCKEYRICGGLAIEESGFFDCSSFCCRDPARCTAVCRYNPDYAFRVREVGGFELDDVPRAPALAVPALPPVVQVMYNASGLRKPVAIPLICLSLYRMFERNGRPRYNDPQALRAAYRLAPETRIILTGTDKDAPLERFWDIETSARTGVIRALRASGVELVTTPNFTLHANRPRWQDLHAMKRIALTHEEFLREDLPAALHVNARTETDFRRWAAFIAARPEITDIAFEFTTLRRERRPQYATWLKKLSAQVDRRLRLLLRGGTEIVPTLTDAFDVVFLDTNASMKTNKRQRATFDSNGRLQWRQTMTLYGEALDELFKENVERENAAMTARLTAETPAGAR